MDTAGWWIEAVPRLLMEVLHAAPWRERTRQRELEAGRLRTASSCRSATAYGRPPRGLHLTQHERQAQHCDLLPGLLRHATDRVELSHGYRFQFANEPGVCARIAAAVERERQCCRILRFQIALEPDLGPITLDVSYPVGGDGTLGGCIAGAAAQKVQDELARQASRYRSWVCAVPLYRAATLVSGQTPRFAAKTPHSTRPTREGCGPPIAAALRSNGNRNAWSGQLLTW
jgi:hypothetical protein